MKHAAPKNIFFSLFSLSDAYIIQLYLVVMLADDVSVKRDTSWRDVRHAKPYGQYKPRG